MNHENLIISNEWSLDDDKNELKVKHRGQESVYTPSSSVITSIHVSNPKNFYFVFDDDEIVLMFDADTGIIRSLRATNDGGLDEEMISQRKYHKWQQFTLFLFREFLRNCGINF